IEDARLSFEEGFSVLTGETGSGKSMCVNALRAALGGRLESETVRAGTPAARGAAVFDNPGPQLRARRAELGIPDDDLITLSREVPASGRAVCRVDGALVSQAELQTERLRLRYASRIAGCALALAEASGGDEQSGADRLAAAIGSGADLAAVDPGLATLLEDADSLVDRLRELAMDARRHADEITVDEVRLTAIEDRLEPLARVVRRHGSLPSA